MRLMVMASSGGRGYALFLSPSRKDDGTPVRKNEAKNLLQPHINRVNEQSTFPSRERKTATFKGFTKIREDDYLVPSKPSTQSSVRTELRSRRRNSELTKCDQSMRETFNV
jgi:hypothetical protein